jgi:hypothetical protein
MSNNEKRHKHSLNYPSQSDMFEKTALPLVDKVLEDYNVCLLVLSNG